MGAALRGDAGQVGRRAVRRRQDGRDPPPARLGDAARRPVRLHRPRPRAGGGELGGPRPQPRGPRLGRRPGRHQGGGRLEPLAAPGPPRRQAAPRPRRGRRVRPLLRRPDRRQPGQGARLARAGPVTRDRRGVRAGPPAYVEKVAPKQRTLSPETLASSTSTPSATSGTRSRPSSRSDRAAPSGRRRPPRGEPPSARSPATTPARSSSERFWLSLALPSTRSMVSSRPTIARSCLSTYVDGASVTAHGSARPDSCRSVSSVTARRSHSGSS